MNIFSCKLQVARDKKVNNNLTYVPEIVTNKNS